MAKMDQGVKKMWVAALRSGKYKQARGALKAVNSKGEASFCCLGVLQVLKNEACKSDYLLALNTQMPPSETFTWANLGRFANVTIDGELAGVSEHNDGSREGLEKTFEQIADAIEAQL